MGGLTSAVDWWEEWQLRVLVLTSLLIQFFFMFFPYLRRDAISGGLRFTMWLAYHAGDAVAIYGLATLFNRHKDEGDGGGSGSSNTRLEVIWAPVLLICLGGQDGVSAYNIEDNELWTRHLLTAVSQVTVAVYVFWRSWPPGGDDDKRLLQAAILLFVPGVLKCFNKPRALKRASIYSLVSSPPAVKQKEGEMTADEYVNRAKSFVAGEQTEGGENRRPSLNDMAEPAGGTGTGIAETILQVQNGTSMLFVDLTSPYSRRLRILEHFCRLTEKSAYGSLRQGLATAFLLLYTKVKTAITGEGITLLTVVTEMSRFILPWAAMGRFLFSQRHAYNHIDLYITYATLCCTAAIEFYSFAFFVIDYYQTPTGTIEGWPEVVGQRSFIGYVARRSNKMGTNVSRLLGCCCKDLLNQHYYWRERPCFSSYRITELVHKYLKDGWKETMHDAASYHRFNDNRGHWTLKRYELEDLGWSIKGPFDESVLRWHIATDFCFSTASSSSSHLDAEVPPTNDDGRNNNRKAAVLCRQMSNYMAYLLLVNPEMLLPGSRRNLCTTAQEELAAIFNNNDDRPPPGLDKRALAEKIASKLRSSSSSQEGSGAPLAETFIHEAWNIAEALQKLGDQKMWEVIQGVWVEMLCYSAGRCRGYLHAKALGQGGEFLSYVWLLMFYMGMETFADKLQREDLPSHEAAGTGNNTTTTPPSTSEQVSTISTTASSLQSQLAAERRAREESERAAAERERAAAERERTLQENMASMLRYLQAQAEALNRPPPPNLVFIPPLVPQDPQHTPEQVSTTGTAASASEVHTDASGASASPWTSEINEAGDMV